MTFSLQEFFKPGICVLDALSAVNIRVANAGSKSQKPQMVVDDVNCFKFCLNQVSLSVKSAIFAISSFFSCIGTKYFGII